jgi:hypothetical protein
VVALGAGLLVIVVARAMLPDAPPLYDGVVPIEPYVWRDPPPGQPGGAKGATATLAVRDGQSPLIAVATPELVPQAQIFAETGGLTMPAAAGTIKVSIDPVPAEGAPPDGHIDGNVYRISVTDERAAPLTAPASARVSVVLRAPDPTLAEATIARFSAGTWRPLKTSPGGFGGTFLAVVTEFGDFAVIAPGPVPPPPATVGAGATPATSPGPPLSQSGGPIASARETSESPAPSAPLGDATGPAVAVVLAALVAAGLTILRIRTRRRARRNPYWGAHRPRRR